MSKRGAWIGKHGHLKKSQTTRTVKTALTERKTVMKRKSKSKKEKKKPVKSEKSDSSIFSDSSDDSDDSDGVVKSVITPPPKYNATVARSLLMSYLADLVDDAINYAASKGRRVVTKMDVRFAKEQKRKS